MEMEYTRKCSNTSMMRPEVIEGIKAELKKYEGGSVDLEIDNETKIAVMTLNNPRRSNALTGKMMVDIADHVGVLEKWSDGKGLILVGTGGTFCSGGDLTFIRKALHYGSEMVTLMQDTLTRLHNLHIVSVALIQGHALGGGAELSTACDFRVMSSSARIGFVQIKMGLTTAWGATPRLVRLLGRQKSLILLNTAKIMDAEEAQKFGLVDHTIPAETPRDELLACKNWLFSNYCQYETDLLRTNKSSVVFCDLNRDLELSLEREKKAIAEHWGGPIQIAALEARVKHNK